MRYVLLGFVVNILRALPINAQLFKLRAALMAFLSMIILSSTALADPSYATPNTCDLAYDKGKIEYALGFSLIQKDTNYYTAIGGCPETVEEVVNEQELIGMNFFSDDVQLVHFVHFAPICNFGRLRGSIGNTYRCLIDHEAYYIKEGTKKLSIAVQAQNFTNLGFLTKKQCENYKPLETVGFQTGGGQRSNFVQIATKNCRDASGTCQTKSQVIGVDADLSIWVGATLCANNWTRGYQGYYLGESHEAPYVHSAPDETHLWNSICNSTDFLPAGIWNRKITTDEATLNICPAPDYPLHDLGVENFREVERQLFRW